MPILSSYILILTHSLTLFTTSYLLLTQPALLTNSSALWLLGESMHVRPSPQSFAIPSEPLAVISLLLAASGLTQLFFASGLASLSYKKEDAAGKGSLGEQAAVLRSSQSTWMALSGIRVLFSGVLAMWIYLIHSERGIIVESENISGIKGIGLLANSIVFTAALCETFFWGYVWTVLKQEGTELAKSVMEGRENRQAVLNQDGTVTWEDKQ